MEKKVSFQKKPYGVMELPDEWTEFMNAVIEVESTIKPNLFFNNFFPEPNMSLGWIPYDQSPNFQSDYFKGFENHVEKFKQLINSGNYEDLVNFISVQTNKSIEQIKKDFSF